MHVTIYRAENAYFMLVPASVQLEDEEDPGQEIDAGAPVARVFDGLPAPQNEAEAVMQAMIAFQSQAGGPPPGFSSGPGFTMPGYSPPKPPSLLVFPNKSGMLETLAGVLEDLESSDDDSAPRVVGFGDSPQGVRDCNESIKIDLTTDEGFLVLHKAPQPSEGLAEALAGPAGHGEEWKGPPPWVGMVATTLEQHFNRTPVTTVYGFTTPEDVVRFVGETLTLDRA